MLLRHALGETLRDLRHDQGRSLRDVATRATCATGYLSEIERGRKEVSSEVLAAVATALETTVAAVLVRAAARLRPDTPSIGQPHPTPGASQPRAQRPAA